MQVKSLIIVAALLSTAALSSHAQSVSDLTGVWNLTAEAFFGVAKGEVVAGDCQFRGSANITQTGNDFTGSAAMTLVSGSQGCPPEMAAQIVNGTVANSVIQMGMLMGGQLGTAQFDGGTQRQKGGPMGGGFMVDSGGFAGTTGTWLGTPSAQIVPTAGVWGLTALVLLLLTVGTLFLRRGDRI